MSTEKGALLHRERERERGRERERERERANNPVAACTLSLSRSAP